MPKQEEIDFASMDFHDIERLPERYFTRMTNKQASDILQKQVDAYHRGGDYRPRKHLGRALEIAVELLRNNE